MVDQPQEQAASKLDCLSTEQLENIVSLSLQPEANIDPAIVSAALELLALRGVLTPPPTAPEQVLEELDTYWNTPDGESQSLYPSAPAPQSDAGIAPVQSTAQNKHSRAWRCFGTIAASIALIVALLTVSQAFGLDIFGTLGRWTDDIFSPEATADTNTLVESQTALQEPQTALQQALSDADIPFNLAPLTLPEGYELDSIESEQSGEMQAVSAFYQKSAEEDYLIVSVDEYYDASTASEFFFLEDTGNAESYVYNGREFYLFTKEDRWNAVWSDSHYLISIRGAETKEDLLLILSSIESESNDKSTIVFG